jgi:DNA-binding PadR family transcriptional regulator
MTGYDIKKFIESSISNFWHESYGQIYPTLKALADDGLVTRNVEQQEGKPNRYVYSITDQGRDELREWLIEPAVRPVPRLELLLKLFFGAEVSVEANRRHVARFREEVSQSLAYLRGIRPRLEEQHERAPGLPYWLLGIQQGFVVQEALLEWCDHADAVFDSLDKEGARAGTGRKAKRRK